MAIPEGSNAPDSRLWGALKKVHCTLSGLSRVDWAFVHFKAALGILLMIPLVQVQTIQNNTTLIFLVLWCVVTIIGFWVSIIGLIMGAQKYETRHKGLRLELVGLWLLWAGPAVFAAIQAGVWIVTGKPAAVAVAFPLVICLAIRARMVMVKTADRSRTVIYRIPEDADED